MPENTYVSGRETVSRNKTVFIPAMKIKKRFARLYLVQHAGICAKRRKNRIQYENHAGKLSQNARLHVLSIKNNETTKKKGNKKMKHLIKTTVLLLALTNTLLACSSDKTMSATATASVTEKTETVAVRDFDGIENSSNIEVIYTKSDRYSVKATHRNGHKCRIYKEGRILHVDNMTNGQNKDSKTILYISAPRIASIANEGIMIFTADKFVTRSLNIDNDGVFQLNTPVVELESMTVSNEGTYTIDGDVKARNLDIHNSGIHNMKSTRLSLHTVKIDNGGVFNLSASSVETNEADIDNGGQACISCNIDAYKTDIHNRGVIKMDSKIDSKLLAVENHGQATLRMDFRGTDAKFENTGVGTIDIALDCERIDASNTGVGSFKLSGKATSTNISATGKSHIDTSGLNKY